MASFPKPVKLPEWASGGTADVVEPTAGEKSLGWVAGQTPPAPYMNWLMGGDFGYFPWLQYVSTFEQQALTWPERQTFQKGFAASGVRSTIAGLDVTSGLTVDNLDVTSGLTVDKVTPAAGTGVLGKPLLDFPIPNGRYLTARHIVNASPLRYGRAYVTPTGFEFSTNAGWDSVNVCWVPDDTASPAILFRLTGSSIRVCRVEAPTPAWFVDAAFTEHASVAHDGVTAQSLTATGAATAQTVNADTLNATTISAGTWVAAGSSGSPFGPNWGNGDVPAAFRKTPWGDVVFRGMVKVSGGTGGSTVMTIPVAYRPTADRFVIISGAGGSSAYQFLTIRVVAATGALVVFGGTTDVNTQYNFDSLRFTI